jgi:hypothetical protein
MSRNIQNMMASKYPSPIRMRDSAPTAPPSNNGSKDKGCSLTPKTIILAVLILSLLFFVLSLQCTFKTVGSVVGLNPGSGLDPKLVALHAVVFGLVAFFIFRMC